MKENDEFYIGYNENSLGAKTKRNIFFFTILYFFIILISSLIFSFSQDSYNNAVFEFDNTTKISGIFHELPYPMIKIKVGENNYKNILLLGFGKFGATSYLENLRREIKNLNGKYISLKGNLIYYDGKTLIQIDENEKAELINPERMEELPTKNNKGRVTLKGEVIDPKCYFGVMKPGQGKIHRSCAIRCISGGIPPVLVISENNDIDHYYLLTNKNGLPINKEILDFVGKKIEVTGEIEELEDWHIFKINEEDIKILF